jgi:adenine-specific DNA-methyltransferase
MTLDYENMTKDELIRHIKKLKREKKYGLIWEEKPENMDLLLDYNYPVLTNIPEKDIITDPSKNVNLLIEGDNLHSLYLLNVTHLKSVDLILIDPPYNTGSKDFIYNDQYVDKDDAWRHSKWISFMNRRLSIARNLLKEDGIIFIHIDENEFAQLKLLCDEIFGYDNFLGVFIWKARSGKGGTNNKIAHEHEFIYCYAKNKDKAVLKTDKRVGAARKEQLRQWGQEIMREDRPYMFYPLLYNPKNGLKAMITEEEFKNLYDEESKTFNDDYLMELQKKYEEEGWHFILPIRDEGFGRWRVGWETAKDLLEKDEIIFELEGDSFKAYRLYPEGNVTETAVGSLILDKGTASTGTKELKRIFGKKVFDTTKPLDVTEYLIDLVMFNKDEGIVLDFFAGSGTTGEAVLQYNRKRNKHLTFILCTNNEMKEEVRQSLLRRGVSEDSEEFQNEGVCRKVTYPKLKAVIEGYDFEGEVVDVLDEVKLTVTNIKRMPKILNKWEKEKTELEQSYNQFTYKVNSDKLQFIGKKTIKGRMDGIPANLKYFMTDMVEKNTNEDQMKIVMANRIYDLLCIKENCFELVEEQNEYRIYQQGQTVMGIYSDFMNLFFDEFKEKLLAQKAQTRILYSFSFTDYVDETLIEDIKEKVILKSIPTQLIRMLDELRK